MIAFLAIALLLGGCAPSSNVEAGNRLGVIAPFEGLYRRSGYNALAIVRDELVIHPGLNSMPWIPVALDTSRDPERAARKVLAPRNVSAIVGPLTPADAVAAYPALYNVDIRWLLPFAQVGGVPTTLDDPAWLIALLEGAASTRATNYDASRIAIAGYEPLLTIIQSASIDAGLAEQIDLPVVWVDDVGEVADGDLLIWLGDAASGVRFVAQARAAHPEVAVWLPTWAAGDVFVEHASALPDWQWENISWGDWLPADGWLVPTLTPAIAEIVQMQNAARHAIALDSIAIEGWIFQSFPLSPE